MSPGQQGELLIPVQKPFLEAHAASRFTRFGVTEAEPDIMKRLVTTIRKVVENFISNSRAEQLSYYKNL